MKNFNRMIPMSLPCTASAVKKNLVITLLKPFVCVCVCVCVCVSVWGTQYRVEIVTSVSKKHRALMFGVQHSKKSCITGSCFVNGINYEVSLYAISARNVKICTTISYLIYFLTLHMTVIFSFDR